jgi:rod shape-determining protein MreD
MRPRTLLLAFVGYLLVTLQASLGSLLPLRILVPELGLLCALHAGLTARDGIAAACAIAFVLGYVTDLLCGAPKGMHALAFVLLCLVAKGASLRLLLRGAPMLAGLAFLFSLSAAGLVVGVRAKVEGGTLEPLLIAPLQAAVTALVAPLLFALLDRLGGRIARPSAFGMGR